MMTQAGIDIPAEIHKVCFVGDGVNDSIAMKKTPCDYAHTVAAA
jgi:hypothetical protein